MNYALILRITSDGPARSISAANAFILERNRAAIQSAIGHQPLAIAVRGHTDLTIGNLKFSGNAQRRRKSFLLFHGTFLLSFDLKLVSQLLHMPSQQPDYRAGRAHGEFVANLGVTMATVKGELSKAWRANEATNEFPAQPIASLVAEKYSRAEWNQKP